jgi:hypothetical protein
MLVMHDVGPIFVRTRKTAGTSVEIALSRHASQRDIITSLSPRDEALRAREAGGAPQHHLRPGHTPRPHPRRDPRTTRPQHLQPLPHKVVSLYFHRHRTAPRIPLEKFIGAGEFRDAVNWPLYTDHRGVVMVDQIIRHQHLQAGLNALSTRIGLPTLALLRTKAQFRPPNVDYRDLLTPAARKAVEEAYAAEFA